MEQLVRVGELQPETATAVVVWGNRLILTLGEGHQCLMRIRKMEA